MAKGPSAPTCSLDRQHVMVQRREGFRPIFAGMDVCAVGQVQTVLENHAGEAAGNLNFGHWLRNRSGFS